MQVNLYMFKFMSNGIGSIDFVVFDDGVIFFGIIYCFQFCQFYKIN